MSVARRMFQFLFRGFTRKKGVDGERVTETNLDRCLNLVDLTALGIGSTLGAGIYVVAGQVAKETAGPSVTVSFLVAAVASVFAGLCYAEFGSRVPKTGSAYVYSYVSVGEFMAFVIGWNLILEYVIGTASVARAWTANFDALVNNSISTYMLEHVPMHAPGLAGYPDFFAVGIVILLTILVSIGVKESTGFNNLFTLINIAVVLYVVICGSFKADIRNWETDPGQFANSSAIGDGGFFPFGFSGVFAGASTCFYAFIGFDVIATAGEEVKNPQRNIPISIILCLLICFLAYFSISAVVTLMCPYYILDATAPLPFVFERVGWPVAKYVIAVGSLCALSTSLFGALFPLPRIIYAMASDGLIFRFLAEVNERFKTPTTACVVSGILSSIMACIFNIKELVDMMSIGTLLAYTLVATSVLLLRGSYTPADFDVVMGPTRDESPSNAATSPVVMSESEAPSSLTSSTTDRGLSLPDFPPCCCQKTLRNFARHIFIRHTNVPSPVSHQVNTVASFMLLALTFVLSGILLVEDFHSHAYIIGVSVLVLFNCSIVIVLAIQPQDQRRVTFKVPLVPWIPAISLLINTYLMMKLSQETWIRFAVWMAVGLIIYFSYGIRKSSEARRSFRSPYETI